MSTVMQIELISSAGPIELTNEQGTENGGGQYGCGE